MANHLRIVGSQATEVNNQQPKKLPERLGIGVFDEALHDPKMLARVQHAMDKTFSLDSNPRRRVLVRTPKVSFELGKSASGVLYPSPKRGEYITSVAFPEYLRAHGYSPSRAVKLATASVLAYSNLYDWASSLTSQQRPPLIRFATKLEHAPKRPELWTAIDLADPANAVHVAVHRAAARVALHAIQGITPYLTVAEEVPAHIAAIADPFTGHQAVLMHDIADSPYL